MDALMNTHERVRPNFPDSKRVAPSVSEVFLSALFQPLIMYTGFTRLTIVKSRKAKIIYAAQAQEAFLHTVPLTMLVYYNNYLLDNFSKLSTSCIIVSCFNLFEIFLETCLY